jgi:hypothetical protein
MKFEVTRRQMKLLADAQEEDQRRALRKMTPLDLLAFDVRFENWAHKN